MPRLFCLFPFSLFCLFLFIRCSWRRSLWYIYNYGIMYRVINLTRTWSYKIIFNLFLVKKVDICAFRSLRLSQKRFLLNRRWCFIFKGYRYHWPPKIYRSTLSRSCLRIFKVFLFLIIIILIMNKILSRSQINF